MFPVQVTGTHVLYIIPTQNGWILNIEEPPVPDDYPERMAELMTQLPKIISEQFPGEEWKGADPEAAKKKLVPLFTTSPVRAYASAKTYVFTNRRDLLTFLDITLSRWFLARSAEGSAKREGKDA